MKTNITLSSNIFIRRDKDILRDPEFTAQVTGRSALKKLKSQYNSSFGGIRLSEWQEKMYSEDQRCSLAKDHEMTHGLVRKDNYFAWEGRCEYSSCPKYNQCSETKQFNRMDINCSLPVEEDKSQLTYERLGNIEELLSFNIPNGQSSEEVSQEDIPQETIPQGSIIEDVKTFVAQDEYEKIDSPACIIEDDIESHILVNAAPGSGKTYTAIHRIEYIIQNRLVDDFSKVLVLVYTNAAKKEILSRREAGVFNGTLPFSAMNVDVCTFDSLATSYLSDIEEKFESLDYNDRIKLFNKKCLSEKFSNFEYVIVDELQDLVNERAKMVLNILSSLSAIYDYDCHGGDNISSVEFYKRLREILPANIKKYELTGNQRQVDKLASISDNIRCALLNFDASDANEFVAEELKSIRVVDSLEHFDFHSITSRSAILCRNNGEAEYVSYYLHKKGIQHNFLRSVVQEPSLRRFIADCLWDYHVDLLITRTVFCERYCARVNDDSEEASNAFDALSESVYGKIKESIELEQLAYVLSRPMNKLDVALTNKDDFMITVSTIHKAKGREFDTVFLLDSKFTPAADNTEEARVWYVGCTRAKKELYILPKKIHYFKRSTTYNQRWMMLLMTQKKKWNRPLAHCKNIVLGLPGDCDEAGFVKGDFETALKMQEYIAKEVNIGDAVDVVLCNGTYQVRHQDQIVGYLSKDMFYQLMNIACESNPSSNAPPYLSSVFVSNIVTVTPFSFPDGVDLYFRESRFWLGLELTGFPKIDWHYTRPNDVSVDNLPTNAYSDWSALK